MRNLQSRVLSHTLHICGFEEKNSKLDLAESYHETTE